jgi:Fe2+ or Zn2+ uptake regulation protein
MIEQLQDRTWKVECDRCGEVIHTGQKSFQQAVNYISRAEGWESRETRGIWRNYCPRCREEANPDMDLAGIGFTKKIADDE